MRFSWREGGIEREMCKTDARTAPVTFELPDGTRCTVGGNNGKVATRRKYPAKSGDLRKRWCSGCVKIDVGASALAHDPRFRRDVNVLVVTGERRAESTNGAGRALYATAERHRADAPRWRRRVDHWRPVLEWSEADVWAILKRHHVRPHPAYYVGFGRTSCMTCVFNGPNEWATIRHLDPERFARHVAYEADFDYTIDPGRRTLVELADRGEVFPMARDPELRALAMGTTYDPATVLVPEDEEWVLPTGAYRTGAGPG